MKPISFATVVATCATLVLVAGSANAQTAAEAKCRGAIAKNITKYQAALVKNVTLCHKLRNLNKAPYNLLNCNDVNAADTKHGLALARTKLIAGVGKLCEPVKTPTAAAAVLALFPRCPSPSKTIDDGGATTGIDTFSELSSCLMNLSDEYVSRISAEAFGLPSLPTTAPIKTCQAAIGLNLGKSIAAYAKARTLCQGARDKALSGLSYGCATNDSAGAIAAANTALDTAIQTSCNGTPTTLAGMGACGQTASQLRKCVTNRLAKRVGGGLVALTYELPAGRCAGSADVVINAGYGAQLTNTSLDSGYTGFGHNVDLEDGYLGGVSMSGCDADCENCAVSLDRSPAGKQYAGYSTCRCDNDASVACSTIEGADAACGGSTCHCLFGPPLPLSAGNAPVCVLNRFQEDFGGSTGKIGEYDVITRTAAVIHLGDTATHPCPTCEGDTTANDGNKGGHCNGGSRDGLTCDANANSPDFGPVSFDCQPAASGNITGTGLKMGLTFTDGTATITAALSGSSVCDAGTCHCAECSGDHSVGCSANADCAAVGAGTCTTATTVKSKQNSCDGLACDDDGSGTNQGVCGAATPPLTFCNGQLRGNGEGYISCTDQADCDAMDADCTGGDCGTCGDGPGGTALRKCFLPTVTATGTPGIFGSEGVATFCSAATSNSGVNASGGLPGPGRVTLDFDFDLYCADHTTPFDLPGGSNCP